MLARFLVEADHGADGRGEEREAAGDEGRVTAAGAHGAHQFRPASGEGDAAGDDVVDHRGREALEERHALAQRRFEGDLAAHGPLGDGRDMILEADEIGELVDAFLADHGGIHVGEEQALHAPRGGLHDDVDGKPAEGDAHGLGEDAVVRSSPRCERNVGGDALGENRGCVRAGQVRAGRGQDIGGQDRVLRMGDEGRDVGQGEVSREGHRPRAVLIAGPTASGKSALALDLARRFGGVVINADSMQVYRDLRIITARPTEDETALAPHRLYGTVDAARDLLRRSMGGGGGGPRSARRVSPARCPSSSAARASISAR
jgi:hypothetical protein